MTCTEADLKLHLILKRGDEHFRAPAPHGTTCERVNINALPSEAGSRSWLLQPVPLSRPQGVVVVASVDICTQRDQLFPGLFSHECCLLQFSSLLPPKHLRTKDWSVSWSEKCPLAGPLSCFPIVYITLSLEGPWDSPHLCPLPVDWCFCPEKRPVLITSRDHQQLSLEPSRGACVVPSSSATQVG